MFSSTEDRFHQLEMRIKNLEEKVVTQDVKLEEKNKQIISLQQQVEELSKLDEKVIFGKAILHSAIAGDINRMRLALDKGGDKEAKDASGHTALYLSLLLNHVPLADLLIERGAALSVLTETDILHVMCQKDNLATVKFIIAKLPKDDKDATLLVSAHTFAATAEIKQAIADAILIQAVKQDNVKLTATALTQGANINARYDNGETALHKACHLRYTEIVGLLLKNGCSTTLRDNYHKTAEELVDRQEIKQLFSDYRHIKALTVIQAHVRGFLQREELQKLKEQKEILQSSAELVSQLTSSKKFEEAGQLLNLLQSNHWEDAKEILIRHNQQNHQTQFSKSTNGLFSTNSKNEGNISTTSNNIQANEPIYLLSKTI